VTFSVLERRLHMLTRQSPVLHTQTQDSYRQEFSHVQVERLIAGGWDHKVVLLVPRPLERTDCHCKDSVRIRRLRWLCTCISLSGSELRAGTAEAATVGVSAAGGAGRASGFETTRVSLETDDDTDEVEGRALGSEQPPCTLETVLLTIYDSL